MNGVQFESSPLRNVAPPALERAWPPQRADDSHSSWVSRITRRHLIVAASLVLLLLSLWQFGSAAWIHLKAMLAQQLIAQAWARAIDGEPQPKPWPWADTWPVARLRVPRLDETQHVLAGADNRTIAFGPGHVHGTARPGTPGNVALGAHRDTHFAFLSRLRRGDTIELEDSTRHTTRYAVRDARVVDKGDLSPLRQDQGSNRLTLITCYPFDAVTASGPLRYVVTAVEMAPATAPTTHAHQPMRVSANTGGPASTR